MKQIILSLLLGSFLAVPACILAMKPSSATKDELSSAFSDLRVVDGKNEKSVLENKKSSIEVERFDDHAYASIDHNKILRKIIDFKDFGHITFAKWLPESKTIVVSNQH